MDERLYWLGFSVFPGVGPKKFDVLLKTYGSAKDAWKAQENELKAVLGNVLSEKFVQSRKTFSLETYAEKLTAADVSFLTLDENTYPTLLASSSNPPFVLYIKGKFDFQKYDRSIAIVGTRMVTSYGREVTTQLTAGLVQQGFTIVSGLALGVDAISHQTTIDTNGKTIAVLGCGVDCCSPRENTRLYNEILENGGAIVSEYPLSAEPTKGSFPSRNRIIAGLSQAVLLTEGAADSGALYTADAAFKNQRKVFAVPGPITSQLSKAPNALIAKGAKLVTGVEDILRELDVKSEIGDKRGNGVKSIKGDTLDEQKIIDLLQHEQLYFDELVRKSSLESSTVGALLSLMEMKGYVKHLDGDIYGLS